MQEIKRWWAKISVLKKEKIQYIFIYTVVTIFILAVIGSGGYLVYKKNKEGKILNKEVQIPDEMRQKYLQRIDEIKRKIEEKDPAQFDLYMELGNIEYSLGRLNNSIDAYKKVGEISPKNYPSFSNLGNIYLELKWYKKAQSAYLKSIENSPVFTQAYLMLFEMYKLDWEGKKYDPEEILLKALEAQPKHPDLLINLAVYYKNVEEKEKAIEYYKKHLEVNPENEAAKKELGELQK